MSCMPCPIYLCRRECRSSYQDLQGRYRCVICRVLREGIRSVYVIRRSTLHVDGERTAAHSGSISRPSASAHAALVLTCRATKLIKKDMRRIIVMSIYNLEMEGNEGRLEDAERGWHLLAHVPILFALTHCLTLTQDPLLHCPITSALAQTNQRRTCSREAAQSSIRPTKPHAFVPSTQPVPPSAHFQSHKTFSESKISYRV